MQTGPATDDGGPPASRGPRRWREFAAAGLPLALTAAVYLRSLGNGFVYDDLEMVVRNRYLGRGSFVWKSFLHDSWWFRDPLRLPQSYYYRPLENAWLALNYRLFGTNPPGWHASMIAVALVGVWLVFLLARDLTRDRIAAAIAAALFGLMPIHAGAISWGRSIPMPMSAELEVGALLCFMRRADAPRRNLAVALALYGAALLTHESAAMFPAIVAMYVFLFKRAETDDKRVAARLWAAVRACAPFAAMVAAYGALRLLIFGLRLPVSERNAWSALECVLTIPGALGQYALLLAIPWRAGPAHELRAVSTIGSPAFWLPTLALAAAGVCVWLALRDHPHRRLYLFCAGSIVLALVPFLNLASLTPAEAIQDRYLFLPSAMWCIALGDLAAGFIAAGDARAWIASAATVAIALLYGGWLWHIEPYWHDDLAYFSRCIEMSPSSWVCHADLGLELARRGDLRGAEREIEASLPLRPKDGIGLFNLAGVHIRMDKFDLAERELLEALKSMRRPPPAIFVELAQVADVVGDHDISERALARLARLPDGQLSAAIARARIRLHHHDYAGAAATLRALAPAQRDEINAWTVLARADSMQSRPDLALEDYTAALRLEPNRASLHALRALTLARLGRRDEALGECKRALELDPGDTTAQALMARLRAAPHP